MAKKSKGLDIVKVTSWAHKHRPTSLEEVVGQRTAVRKIEGMIKTRHIPSAILLCGPTGIGKTTLAGLIARYLNCATLDNCGECESCKIPIAEHNDYDELNMSDKRGIDDIRAIVQRARNKPMIGNFKIFTLDECHQLTYQATQNFLKPLESPPPHTIWILVTSEPARLPDTVLGRCTILNLEKPSQKDVLKRLTEVAKAEGVHKTFDKELLSKMSEMSGGHVRNAIQLLESASAYVAGSKKVPSTEKLMAYLGRESQDGGDKDEELLASKVLLAVYAQKASLVWKFMIDMDGQAVSLVNKMLFFNSYLLDSQFYTGWKKGVFHSQANLGFKNLIEQKLPDFHPKKNLRVLASLNAELLEIRRELTYSNIGERMIIASRLCKWIANK